MFSKLLKHDSRAIFKYWWIGALVSMCISVLGGMCIQVVDVDYTKYNMITTLAGIGIFFSVVGIMLLPLFTEIILLVRYYKNFFTDEGYLTFTLPVKKTSLLDSKLLSALIFNAVSTLIMGVDVFIMLAVGIPQQFFDVGVWREFFSVIGDVFRVLGGYSIGYIILGILILLAVSVAQTLFIFACLTLASSIVKKHKILLTIGIYYGASIALSIVLNILSFGGIPTVFTLISQLNQNNSVAAIMFILMGVLGIFVLGAGALYLFVLYLLDRRLNLE